MLALKVKGQGRGSRSRVKVKGQGRGSRSRVKVKGQGRGSRSMSIFIRLIEPTTTHCYLTCIRIWRGIFNHTIVANPTIRGIQVSTFSSHVASTKSLPDRSRSMSCKTAEMAHCLISYAWMQRTEDQESYDRQVSVNEIRRRIQWRHWGGGTAPGDTIYGGDTVKKV